MTIAKYDAYITSVNEIEERIIDDDKNPIVRDNKIKVLQIYFRINKILTKYLKMNICNEKNKDRK